MGTVWMRRNRFPLRITSRPRQCGQTPAVFDAVVVGLTDERWGERVAAVVQLRDGQSLTLEDIDTHARQHIAGYKVPRLLCVVDEMMRQPSGKADYRWAKEQAMKAAQAVGETV